MATDTLGDHTDIGMEETRIPTQVPPLVAGVTISRARQTSIRNMGSVLAICRQIRT